MQTLGGVKIRIRSAEPETKEVKCSWIERLFTRPWRPHVAKKTVTDEGAITRNKTVYHSGNSLTGSTLVMTAETFEEFKKIHKQELIDD